MARHVQRAEEANAHSVALERQRLANELVTGRVEGSLLQMRRLRFPQRFEVGNDDRRRPQLCGHLLEPLLKQLPCDLLQEEHLGASPAL